MRHSFSIRGGRAALIIVAILHLSLPAVLLSQSATVSGFVSDETSGEALIGANVYLSGTQIGASSNLSGYYVIPGIPPGAYELVIHYIGYTPYTETISLQSDADVVRSVRLKPTELQMGAVTVTAEAPSESQKLYNKAVSKLEISPRQLRSIPQVGETDLFRSLQTLPGIVPISDYSSAPYVRGGTPDQNLYLVDGADVYNPEHAFGIFSVFNTDAIKHVDVYKGGFGAEFGGRLSSVINVTHLDGNRERFQGSFGLSLLSAKAVVQVPLGHNSCFSASFRRTYFDQTVARIIDGVPQYYFYDGNLKLFWHLNGRNSLTFSVFVGRDFFDYTFNDDASEQLGLIYDWGNRTASVRWNTIFSPKWFASFWITGSWFSSGFDLIQTLGMKEENDLSDVTLKGEVEYVRSNSLSFKGGFEQKHLDVVYRQTFPDSRADIDKSPIVYSSYVEAEVRPSRLWEFSPGIRLSYFSSDTNFFNWEPRFSVKHRLSDSISLKAATGTYHQYLNRIPRAFIADIWTTADRFQRESSSRHLILSYQQDVGNTYQLELETFYKNLRNIHVFNDAFLASVKTDIYEDGMPVYQETTGLFNEGDGSSKGVELLLTKKSGLLSGWIGYSLSQTRYRFGNINGGNSYAPRHDKTSTVNVVGDLDIKRTIGWLKGSSATAHGNWRLGFNFVYASGQPITFAGSGYAINSLPDFQGVRNLYTGNVRDFATYPGAINAFRLPAYARLDLSLRYEKQYKGWSIVSSLQVFNAGNRRNVWFLLYKDDSEGFVVRSHIDKVPMFPVLPSLGLEVHF